MQKVEYSRSGRIRKAPQAFDPDRLEAEQRRKMAQQSAKSTNAGGGASSDDERVVLWNTVTKRKSAGNTAPRRTHLEQYLRAHPEYELYTGQDKKRAPAKTKVRNSRSCLR